MLEDVMAAGKRWIFSYEQLQNTPSRQDGVDYNKELFYRQQAASTIQDLGQKLNVTQLCINTAIVYMHRFYVFHSFVKHSRNTIATTCLFLAAKIEEQPRKLEHLIRFSGMVNTTDNKTLDTKSKEFLEKTQELVEYESFLLQTLGFDLTVTHPHMHVMETCNLVRAPKDLAQTSYFLATNSLHLTTLSLQYVPKVISVVCIHLACKWSNWEIPESSEGHPWWYYTEKTITAELIEKLTREFLAVLDECPSKLKTKIMQWENKKSGDSPGGFSPSNTLAAKLNIPTTSFTSQTKTITTTSSTSSCNESQKQIATNVIPNRVEKIKPPHLPSTEASSLKRSQTEPIMNAGNQHHQNRHVTSGNGTSVTSSQIKSTAPSKKQITGIALTKISTVQSHKRVPSPKTPPGEPPIFAYQRKKKEAEKLISPIKTESNVAGQTLNLLLPKRIQESINLPTPLSPLDKPNPTSNMLLKSKVTGLVEEKHDSIVNTKEEEAKLPELKLRIKMSSAVNSPTNNDVDSDTKSNKSNKKKKKHKEHKHKKHKSKEKESKKRSHSPTTSPSSTKIPKVELINGAVEGGLKLKLPSSLIKSDINKT